MASKDGCWICGGPCAKNVDEFSFEFDCPLHLVCLQTALAEIQPGNRELIILAREFGMARAAPGRKAVECPQGHETIAKGTRYKDGKCKTCHKRVILAAYHRRQQRKELLRAKALSPTPSQHVLFP